MFRIVSAPFFHVYSWLSWFSYGEVQQEETEPEGEQKTGELELLIPQEVEEQLKEQQEKPEKEAEQEPKTEQKSKLETEPEQKAGQPEPKQELKQKREQKPEKDQKLELQQEPEQTTESEEEEEQKLELQQEPEPKTKPEQKEEQKSGLQQEQEPKTEQEQNEGQKTELEAEPEQKAEPEPEPEQKTEPEQKGEEKSELEQGREQKQELEQKEEQIPEQEQRREQNSENGPKQELKEEPKQEREEQPENKAKQELEQEPQGEIQSQEQGQAQSEAAKVENKELQQKTQEQEIPKQIPDTRTPPQRATEIEYIRNKVLSYVDTKTLKECRLASKAFSSWALTHLKRRKLTLRLNFSVTLHEYVKRNLAERMQYQERLSYSRRSRINQSNTLSQEETLQAIEHMKKAFASRDNFPPTKLVLSTSQFHSQYIQSLLATIGFNFKTLQLQLNCCYYPTTLVGSQVLQYMSELLRIHAPNVEHLGISFSIPTSWEDQIEAWNEDETTHFFDPEENVKLPHLKVVSIEDPFPMKAVKEICAATNYTNIYNRLFPGYFEMAEVW